MGSVYLAREIAGENPRRVEVRVLPSALAADRQRFARFTAEMEIASRLDHPNLLSVYEIGADGDTAFVVTAHGGGRTLGRVVAEDGPLPQARIVGVAVQIAGALDALHRRGLVHGRITSAGIAIDAEGRATLADVGVSRLGTGAPPLRAAHYMAPEQWEGNPDHRSDLYSLGAVLYEAATAAPPFAGKSVPEVMSRHLAEPPVPLARLRPDLMPGLGRIIEACLAKAPEDRYRSADALRRDLLKLDPTAAAPRTGGDAAIPAQMLDGGLTEPVRSLAPEVYALKPPSDVLRRIRASDRCLTAGDPAGAIWHLELFTQGGGDPALVEGQLAVLRRLVEWEAAVRSRAETAVAERR